jgi:dTDP-4-amino-4,6-dideoxygalactose transaminase
MIPFSPPRIDQKIIDEVVQALQSGWITTGPRTKEFERRLSSYCGNPFTLCLNSATAGLELVLRWFGVQEGDEVILPAYTYASTANVIIHCGAKPVMVDIDDNFLITAGNISRALTERTKVVMPVDFGGFPCDYDSINSLVSSEKAKSLFRPKTEEQRKLGRVLVLSDAAHSLGASVNGIKTGNLTDVSVFSFHAVKNLTTAEGGAVALNLPAPFSNEEIYKFLVVLSLHGQNKDALAKMQKGNWKYDIITAGYKCNMTDMAAAIGLVELGRYDSDMLPARRKIFDFYRTFFDAYKWAEVPTGQREGYLSSYHLFPLRIKDCNESQRDLVISEIFNQDVSVNVHFMPLPLLSFYKNLGYRMEDFPLAYHNYSREISLPVYYGLTEEQCNTVCEAVKNAVESVLKL